MNDTAASLKVDGQRSPAGGFADGAAQLPDELGRIGSLSVRLARTQQDIEGAQRLRFNVLEEAFGRRASGARELDIDRFDPFCEHLLVVDDERPGPDSTRIVGTYRLLLQSRANEAGGFYSSTMFALPDLIARHPSRKFLEVGRSCVLPQYRTRKTIDALWLGIWSYIRFHRIDVLTGCASFPGTDPASHVNALSLLAQQAADDPAWHVRALPTRRSPVALRQPGSYTRRAALDEMPPLIKGYLRLGARFGDGCVIDPDMGTVVVLVVLPIERVAERYRRHYLAHEQKASSRGVADHVILND